MFVVLLRDNGSGEVVNEGWREKQGGEEGEGMIGGRRKERMETADWWLNEGWAKMIRGFA